MPITTDSDTLLADTALLRLLQLSSVALPVGAYAFSQGLEHAVHKGWLTTVDDTQSWLEIQMSEALASTDLPIVLRQFDAAAEKDAQTFRQWNDWALACRETEELRLTDTATGAALAKLLQDLQFEHPLLQAFIDRVPGKPLPEISFASVFALAAEHWGIDKHRCLHGYLWSWLENQVAAATKLVPLGQVAAQVLLGRLLESAAGVIDLAYAKEDHEVGGSLPNLAMVSSWHESQYSRLFRS